MAFDDLALLSRRDRIRLAVLVAILVAVAIWASVQFLQPGPPRRIVLASGPESGVYHKFARRYIEILGRQGIVVDERMTGGAVDNLALLLDPRSKVDVALLQAGIASFPAADDLVMLASLYYEPLWIFYRDAGTLTRLNQLRGRKIAVGAPGSGTRALAEQMLRFNGLILADGRASDNTQVLPMGGDGAIDALKAGAVDAVLLVGGADAPVIQTALRSPQIKLMSLDNAGAYPRRFSYLSRLTLPAGTIDPSINVPAEEVQMIGTKAMLVAGGDLHPALINLLVDAAREIHGGQGYFEGPGEFPGTVPLDLPVSPDADQHKRFGPSFLYRYLPFWLATLVERMIIVVVPLVVVLVPLVSYLPGFLRWRARSRIYRWYGELALLERDVATRTDALPIEKWLQDLDRIQTAVEGLKTPTMYASEAYTLREHVGLVRRAVLAKSGRDTAPAV
jgi:TRAP transporter TAXI family solute receptor